MHGSRLIDQALVLTRVEPFAIGATRVVPASREIMGPGGRVMIEPRVMQVLVALAATAGAVVTRQRLLDECWNGQFVGEDALNRAIGEVRRVARTVGAGDWSVETIPRTGYRLAVTDGAVQDGTAIVSKALPAADMAMPATAASSPLSRRGLIAAGVAGLAAAAAIWRLVPSATERRAGELVAAGDLALRQDLPDPVTKGVGHYRAAAALLPDDAHIWGRLALGWQAVAEYAGPDEKAAALASCESAARRALGIDSGNGDALAALAMLQPSFGDWLAAEARLRDVLARAPDNAPAAAALAMMLQSVGRSRASAAIGADLVRRDPLSPMYAYRRTYGLWNTGALAAADRHIDRAIELWPRHPGIWFVRLWLSAFTGRAAAAIAMLEDAPGWPPSVTPKFASDLKVSMIALVSGAPGDVRAAVALNRARVVAGPSWAISAIMLLSGMEAVDAAFEVAQGYLLRSGGAVGPLRHSAAQFSVNDQRHRKTMMLFIPPTRVMREDRRFMGLCEGIGMADYWRRSGTRPDFLQG